MTHDLPQQGLGNGLQINQVNGAPSVLGQGIDDGYPLRGSQCPIGGDANVQIAIFALPPLGNGAK